MLALWAAPVHTVSDDLAQRVEGSGPYRGPKAGAIYLLRAGVLQAVGGMYNAYTRWRAHGDGHTVSLSRGGGDELVAHFVDCWVIRFPESASLLGGLLGGGGGNNLSAPMPERYGAGIAARNAEWIIQPAAQLCQDVCAGLTLRKLTSADRAASVAAQSIEDCCGWSWAGFGGLKFLPNGELVSPWGRGVWGAPPEAQSSGQVAILAEFAGSKHLLKGSLETRADGSLAMGRHLQSRRCADNDMASIALTSGTTRAVRK